jgi:hypothetical protein
MLYVVNLIIFSCLLVTYLLFYLCIIYIYGLDVIVTLLF